MAKTDPVTAWTSGVVVATNAAYSNTYKLTLPFRADKVTVKVVSASGNPDLFLSVDGSTDVATLHHNLSGPGSEYTFTMQQIDTLYYKQSGTNCHFIVNDETKAWRNMF